MARKLSEDYTPPVTTPGIPEAPNDGNQYARKDGAWEQVASGGGGGNIIPWDMTPPPAPVIACEYPLNMTQAQAIALDYQDVMSVTGQEASYTIQGGIESYYDVVTGSDQTSPQLIDTTTGKKTILFKFVAPSISPEEGAPWAVAIHGAISDFSGDGSVQIGIGVSDNTTRTVDIYNNFNAVFSATGVSETSYFSMCFDSETSTVYIYNGASPVYAGAYVPKADAQLEVAASENITLYEPDIGKTYTFEVFTSASDIMGAPEVPSYPSGATDICGNPLLQTTVLDASSVGTLGFLPADVTGNVASITSGTMGGQYAATATAEFVPVWASGTRVIEGFSTTFTGPSGNGQNSLAILSVNGNAIVAGYIGNGWVFRLMGPGNSIIAATGVAGPITAVPAVGVDAVTRNVVAYLDGVQITSGPFASGGAAEGFLTGTHFMPAAALAASEGASHDMGVRLFYNEQQFSYAGTTDWAGQSAPVGQTVLPAEAVAGSLLEVTVPGTYDSIPYSVGDVAIVLSDGTTVQKLAPESDGGDVVTSFNGQSGDVVFTPPVTSVNGQTGNVYISIPAPTTIDGASGTIATKKKPAAFGMVHDTYYTLNGFSERHVVRSPSYSFSPRFNQGGGIAKPKISADASWGLFKASRYTSNSSFIEEVFAVDLFTGTLTRVRAGTGWQYFSAVASADGTTIYAGTTQAGSVEAFRRNADGTYTTIGSFSTRYLNTQNRTVIRSSDTQLGQSTPTYIYAGYTSSTPSNVIVRANVSDWATTLITISALANVRNFSVSPDSDHIFAKAIDGSVWMGKADGVTTVALPASITGTVLDAVFQRPGLHQSRINAYKMAVRWDDAGTIKLSIVDFTIEYGGVQIISSYTHYTVDPGDLLAGGGFSVCGTYVSGEYKVIDILTGIEVLNQGGEWIG